MLSLLSIQPSEALEFSAGCSTPPDGVVLQSANEGGQGRQGGSSSSSRNDRIVKIRDRR